MRSAILRALLLLSLSTAGPTQLGGGSPGSDGAWFARAAQHIAAREYWASRNAEGLQAPNRRHDLRTYFDPSGIRVAERNATNGGELLSLRLAAIGRSGSSTAVAPGDVTSERERVVIRREGIAEWFRNLPEGLEHGLDLSERPPGDGPLLLEFSLSNATATQHATFLRFETRTGRHLDYGHPAALDAHGREVAIELRAPTPQRVQIALNDRDAVYPLAIDPLLTASFDTLLESGQEAAQLGASVAGAGDVNGDGYADLVVGAPLYDAGQTDEGAAFVFLGSASGLADATPATAATQLESDQAGAEFGASVAGAGDVNGDGFSDLIAGAPRYDAGELEEGAAFVFLGSATGIADASAAAAATQLESDQIGAELGRSAAGAGDVDGDGYADVIVGAALFDAGELDEGAVFVFPGSASGVADANPAGAATQLQADQADARFGASVAAAGDLDGDSFADVVVGATLFDAGQVDAGAAFAFHGSSSGIANGNPGTAVTQLESDQAGASFGASVAGRGDVNGDGFADLAVGAPLYDAGQTDEGAAFVFLGSALGVADGNPATAAAQLESNLAAARLGRSVASAGDVDGDGYADLIVGANGPTSNIGMALVFTGSSTGIADGSPSTAFAALSSTGSTHSLGYSVAGAGDVDGDGYADVVIGARFYDAAEDNEGAAFVALGGSRSLTGGNPNAVAAAIGQPTFEPVLGASAGDVNGDGFGDVIVGAPSYDAGQTNEGAAFIFHGSASGIASGDLSAAATQLESNIAQVGAVTAEFGASVAAAGDVNRDGYGDVIVGAFGINNRSGAAYLFLGSATGVADGNPTTAATRLVSSRAGAQLGTVAAGIGDVNGDGYADIAIGAPNDGFDASTEGAVLVFHGGGGGIPDGGFENAARVFRYSGAGRVGTLVTPAGDVNGDSYADLLVGTNGGRAFMAMGSATGLPTSLLNVTQIQGQWYGIVSAGDVDADGYADFALTGGYAFSFFKEQGLFVFHGHAGVFPSTTSQGAQNRLLFDSDSNTFPDPLLALAKIAGAGDVDGDGFSELLVGMPGYSNGNTNEGIVFLLPGGPTGIAGDELLPTAGVHFERDSDGELLGNSVAGAGDVNGDGFADVLFSSLRNVFPPPGSNSFVYVALGNAGGDARPIALQQRTSGDTPIQPWSGSSDGPSFDVALLASHPEGRGKVKLEVEQCPPGVPFGDASCLLDRSSEWLEAALDGVELDLPVEGAGLARWRARVLHAPSSVDEPGIAAAPNPPHGPWRRVQAQTFEGDVRLPEPGFAIGLAAGIALLAALANRKR